MVGCGNSCPAGPSRARHSSAPSGTTTAPGMMELFCGTGRLHRVFQRRGWRAQGLDHVLGDDLASKACQRKALARIRSGQCRLVWLGTPCSTFSRARRGPRTHHGPPPPLRSTEHPWGLPDLTQHEIEVVAVSNELMMFTLQVIRLCIHLKVAVALENPMSSIMWCVPELWRFSTKVVRSVKPTFVVGVKLGERVPEFGVGMLIFRPLPYVVRGRGLVAGPTNLMLRSPALTRMGSFGQKELSSIR